MPFGDFVNQLPAALFMVVHITLFAVGAVFAKRAYDAEQSLLGTGFALFALGELSYMTYHLDWTVFLFAHTVSEVLILGAFVAIFAGASQAGVLGGTARRA